MYLTCSTILRFHDFPGNHPSLHNYNVSRAEGVVHQMEEKKYKIIKKIGQGTFGKVYEASSSEKGGEEKKVAIKRVEKATNVISREVEILKSINHEFCIKLLDVFYTSEDGAFAKKFQNLVFEFHPQTLYRFIQSESCSPQIAKNLFYQLCVALRYIHDKKICHRDVTPNNILLSARGHIVLADFGSAKKLDQEHISISYVCSRYYRAPELLLGCSNYSTKVDIWAAGCILAEMLMGKPIFPGMNNQDQFMKIVLILGAPSAADITAMKKNNKHELRFPHIEPLYFGRLLPKTLSEPEIVADLLYGMLCYNPKSRLSIDAVIKHPYFDDIRHLPAERLYVAVE